MLKILWINEEYLRGIIIFTNANEKDPATDRERLEEEEKKWRLALALAFFRFNSLNFLYQDRLYINKTLQKFSNTIVLRKLQL